MMTTEKSLSFIKARSLMRHPWCLKDVFKGTFCETRFLGGREKLGVRLISDVDQSYLWNRESSKKSHSQDQPTRVTVSHTNWQEMCWQTLRQNLWQNFRKERVCTLMHDFYRLEVLWEIDKCCRKRRRKIIRRKSLRESCVNAILCLSFFLPWQTRSFLCLTNFLVLVFITLSVYMLIVLQLYVFLWTTVDILKF